MNANYIAMQAMMQMGKAAQSPAPAAPAQTENGKSFKDVMQNAVQQNTAQQPVKKQEQQSVQANQAQGSAEQGKVQTLQETQTLTESDARVQSKWNFLASLFGANAMEGVDMEQSDMEILKDVYQNLNDPDAQFAVLLMMAFLEANPDRSIDEISQYMGSELTANPAVSPTQKVFSAITRIMAADPQIQASSMMDQMMQMARSKQPINRSFVNGLMFEMNLEVLAYKNGTHVAKTDMTDAQLLDTNISSVNRFEQMLLQTKQPGAALEQNTLEKDTKTGAGLDVEKLQQQVDAGSFLRSSGFEAFRMEQAGGVKQWVPVDAGELVNQVKTGIFSGLEKGENEFVFKLRPEGLGEMTVRLVENGAKTTLSIIASSVQTQRLLSSELANLQAVMKPYEVEVQPVVTTQQASTDEQFLFGQSGQQFGEHQHGESFRGGQPFQQGQQEDQQTQQARGIPLSMGSSALDAYI